MDRVNASLDFCGARHGFSAGVWSVPRKSFVKFFVTQLEGNCGHFVANTFEVCGAEDGTCACRIFEQPSDGNGGSSYAAFIPDAILHFRCFLQRVARWDARHKAAKKEAEALGFRLLF